MNQIQSEYRGLSEPEQEFIRFRPERLRRCMLIYYALLVTIGALALGIVPLVWIFKSPGILLWSLGGIVLCWIGAICAGATALRSLGADWLESLGLPAIDFVLTPLLLILTAWPAEFHGPSILHRTLKQRVKAIRDSVGSSPIEWADDVTLRELIRKWSGKMIRMGYCPKCRYEVGTLPRCPECGLFMQRVLRRGR